MGDFDEGGSVEQVRDEVIRLGHMADEAEALLTSFFDVDVSGAIKRADIEQCKMKLVELRASIVAMGEVTLNAVEDRTYRNYIDRFDVLRRQQQGMEDVLFGSLEGPGRLPPLRALILG